MDETEVFLIALGSGALGVMLGAIVMWWRMGVETDYWRQRAKRGRRGEW